MWVWKGRLFLCLEISKSFALILKPFLDLSQLYTDEMPKMDGSSLVIIYVLHTDGTEHAENEEYEKCYNFCPISSYATLHGKGS